VTSRAATPARRGKLTREAARREAVDALTIASAVAAYSARSIGNGLSPEQARAATLTTAVELEHIAGTLRRLARLDLLDRPERRRLVAELAATGMSQRAIAAAVGVDKRTVWDDLQRSRRELPRLAEVPGADRGDPRQMRREEALPLGGGLGGGYPPGGLLGADRGEGVIEGVLLVSERGREPVTARRARQRRLVLVFNAGMRGPLGARGGLGLLAAAAALCALVVGAVGASYRAVHQPRSRHSARWGRSAPSVVSRPCPGYTHVASGSGLNRRSVTSLSRSVNGSGASPRSPVLI